MAKKFNILTIDGGGIRGVFPAKFLSLLEDELAAKNITKNKLYQHFDLISGTSTGGIIALSLALGISAKEIYDIYLNNAKKIFGKKRPFYSQLFKPKYDQNILGNLLKDKFNGLGIGNDPRLNDCKTHVCIPIYDLLKGNPSVLKSKYHPRFIRDFHIPAYQAALATSAAPTYFAPYSNSYEKIDSQVIENFSNKIDGGVVANNPTIVALIEAIKAFHVKLKDIQILSIGTGEQKYYDVRKRNFLGLSYWFNPCHKRILNLFLQGQSQLTNNYISLLQNGIDRSEGPNFIYKRINTSFPPDFEIDLDDTNPDKLNRLSELAATEFQTHGNDIIATFIRD